MDQINLKRARPGSISILVPRVRPVAEITRAKSMSYNNYRPPSPGGRRIQNAARMSESTLTDPYYQQRHAPYASPRTSGGVIPISSQTFVTTTTAPAARPEQRYDSYSGRPRRSSLVDTQRGTVGSASQMPSRTRPIVQQEYARPASPNKTSRDKDYYVTSASSQEPRVTTSTHKKLYSVDDGSAKLVADVNIVAGGGERHHKRRESVEKGLYSRPSGTEQRDHNRRSYHVNGTNSRPKDKSIDDDDAYSYTDPAAMYRETEPRWRETRTRRGSLDRSGAPSRERPVSVIDPTFGIKPQNAKELGPPPSTRGWDKINDPGRVRTQRDAPREVAQSPTRGRSNYQEYLDPRDQYYVPPRANSSDRRATINNYDSYEYEDRMPRKPERRNSVSRDARPDPSVERRGFGIRVPETQPRFAGRDGRGSDESFTDQAKYRDSGYAEPHRRDTAPDYYPPDNTRLDQERKDRELAQRFQAEEHSRTRDRGYSDVRERERDFSRDARRREDDRTYIPGEFPRDRDHDKDRERERERPRPSEPADRDRERNHHRRDTADRDRDASRKENSPKRSGEGPSKSGLAATGVLGGAAAALGLSSILNRSSDKRDKEKDRDDHQERDRERSDRDRSDRDRSDRDRSDRDRSDRERPDRSERDREDRHERNDRRNGDDREPPRERKQAGSDEHNNSDRDRPDRGLGFAYESTPEPPRSAPPTQTEWSQPQERKADERRVDWGPPPPVNPERGPEKQPQERASERVQERPQERPLDRAQDRPQERPAPREHDRERERERDRDRDHSSRPVEQPTVALDADEDYRRRMEQVQRELGLGPVDDQRNSDSDPDRERRRREREQRQREREGRNGTTAGASMESSFNEMPPHPALRHGFDDQSALGSTSTLQPDLKRRPSVLDRPMTNEPAQIIDNSLSERRENRVRIVDPPSEEEEKKPRGILKKPTEKFPEDPNSVREGVAPLKDGSKKGIPPGARWTKIDRRLVNPEALEAAQERFEERLDCVIVLRVLTKEEIQKLADKTRDIRDRRFEEEQREERKAARRSDRNRDRRDRDEFEYSDSEDEYKKKAPKMLEAPSTAGSSQPSADFIRDNLRRHEREREPEPQYSMSGGLGSRRDEPLGRY